MKRNPLHFKEKFMFVESNIVMAPLQKKIRFSVKDLFCKCEQIRSLLQICSSLLKTSLIEKFIFCAQY